MKQISDARGEAEHWQDSARRQQLAQGPCRARCIVIGNLVNSAKQVVANVVDKVLRGKPT
jgi:hypothetical protein